jgi:hypothetical protein
MRSFSFAAVAALMMVGCAATHTSAERSWIFVPPDNEYARLMAATGMIEFAGQWWGTGELVDVDGQPMLLTAAHVVDVRDAFGLKSGLPAPTVTWRGIEFAFVRWSLTDDVAIYAPPTAVELPRAITIAARRPADGASVWCCGYPIGYPMVSRGRVVRSHSDTDDIGDYFGAPGASGSGVYAWVGGEFRLAGVHVRGRNLRVGDLSCRVPESYFVTVSRIHALIGEE